MGDGGALLARVQHISNARPKPDLVTDAMRKDNSVRLALLLVAVLLQLGCGNRICQTKSLKMQWVDGTTSTMEIMVCRPLFAWR
jgi:hypothetical protein